MSDNNCDKSESSSSSSSSTTTVVEECGQNNVCRKPRSYLPCITSSMKWLLACALALLFLIFAYSGTYCLTNSLLSEVCFPSYYCAPGCVTTLGVIVHAIVFLLVIRLILW